MTIKYTSVQSLSKYLGIYNTIPNKDSTSSETVGTGNGSTTVFWLDRLGVITASYEVYVQAGSTKTTLTDINDYVLDLDTSKITLTSGGVTTAGSNTIYADYSYNKLEILNDELENAIRASENKIELYSEQRFADYTANNPGYRKIVDEQIKGHYDPENKVYDLFFSPLVKLHTSLANDYTTGGTVLTATSATGFPTSGTIYIGGYKVAYTAKSTNTLTVPSTTPTITAGATIRGEVLEISTEPEGSSPSFTVIDPDTEYEIDYDNGRIKILNNAYWGEIDADDRLYPSNYLVSASYMASWHENGANPTIPEEIEELANMIAAKKIVSRMVHKAHASGLNDFNPEGLDIDDEEIKRILDYYKPLNVGTSPYNKQFLS